ncbi:MAG: hypothetical protein ACLUI3_03195 [Christensenellales bacterium]
MEIPKIRRLGKRAGRVSSHQGRDFLEVLRTFVRAAGGNADVPSLHGQAGQTSLFGETQVHPGRRF